MSNPTPPLSIGKLTLSSESRHAFLCAGPECCSSQVGEQSWETLKSLIAQSNAPALRTKTFCLRICKNGPWLLIYPDGIWYSHATPDRIPRIIQEHLLEGRPIEEWIAFRHPLNPPKNKNK